MARERVRFGIDLDRETDAEVKKLATLERTSKRDFHRRLCRRVVRLWKEQPDQLRTLKLVREEA